MKLKPIQYLSLGHRITNAQQPTDTRLPLWVRTVAKVLGIERWDVIVTLPTIPRLQASSVFNELVWIRNECRYLYYLRRRFPDAPYPLTSYSPRPGRLGCFHQLPTELPARVPLST